MLPRSFTKTFTVVKLKSELGNTLEPTSVLGRLHVSRPGLTQPPPPQRFALGGHTPVPLLPPASRVWASAGGAGVGPGPARRERASALALFSLDFPQLASCSRALAHPEGCVWGLSLPPTLEAP